MLAVPGIVSPWAAINRSGLPAVLVLLFAGIVEVSATRRPAAVSGHVVTSFAYAATIAIMVGQMNDHPWQIDMHMDFFAALAIVSALCSWPAILGCVGFVAAHHLVLNCVLSDYVFGGASDLPRVLLHAVIPVSEGAALGGLTFVLSQMFARSAADMQVVHQAQRAGEALMEERCVAQTRQTGFVTLMIERIGEIAEGEFDRLLAESAFPPEYDGVRKSLNLLSSHMNSAIATVAEAADAA